MYFSQVRVDPTDDKHLYVLGISLYRSTDGGKTFKGDGGNGVHPDQHALWIDPRDGRHMLVGCDGGFYATYDRMDHWDILNTHGHRPVLSRLRRFAAAVPRLRRLAGQRQLGRPEPVAAAAARSTRTGSSVSAATASSAGSIRPTPTWSTAESQDGDMVPAQPQDRRSRPASGPKRRRASRAYRFNWNTPFILSHHNPHIFYGGGNYVFRSVQAGRRPARHFAGDHAAPSAARATALAESPRNPDVLWAGTRRRRPVGDARRRREVDQRRGQGRSARSALGGQHRGVALRRRPGLRRLRRPPLRRRRAVCLRHGGLRRDVEVAARQPADRLDARAARGHREREPALPRHRVRRVGVAGPRRIVDEDQQQPADGGGLRVRAAPDGRRDGGGDARPQPVGAGRDGAAADDGRRAEGEGAPVPAERRGALAFGADARRHLRRPAAGASSARTRRSGRRSTTR